MMTKKSTKMFTSFHWLMLLVTIFLLHSCTLTETKRAINEFTDFQVLPERDLYPNAKKAALEWQEDAYLDMITLNVFPKTEKFSSSATFFFRSYEYPESYFTYRYTENTESGVGEVSQWTGEFTNPKPPSLEIDLENLPIDSFEALKIMYDELGKEIYSDCSIVSWPHYLGLEQRIPGLNELTWSMSFTCATPQIGGAIIISAETGEVLEIRQ